VPAVDSLRKYIKRYRNISWLLVVALLLQVLFPLHYHLHHDASPLTQNYEHVVHSHSIDDSKVTEHITLTDIHELKITPDVVAKQDTNNGFTITLFICLLILLPAALTFINRLWLATRNNFIRYFYYDLAPPLRAPPAV